MSALQQADCTAAPNQCQKPLATAAATRQRRCQWSKKSKRNKKKAMARNRLEAAQHSAAQRSTAQHSAAQRSTSHLPEGLCVRGLQTESGCCQATAEPTSRVAAALWLAESSLAALGVCSTAFKAGTTLSCFSLFPSAAKACRRGLVLLNRSAGTLSSGPP